ncbi:hypothetical protein T439DRAFT_327863 [Meredithblackwellia eburnea MCA 4105]
MDVQTSSLFDNSLQRPTRHRSESSASDTSDQPSSSAQLHPHPRPPGPTVHQRNSLACSYCRRSKMRCVRESTAKPCKRCIVAKQDCVIPARRPRKRKSDLDPQASRSAPHPPQNRPHSSMADLEVGAGPTSSNATSFHHTKYDITPITNTSLSTSHPNPLPNFSPTAPLPLALNKAYLPPPSVAPHPPPSHDLSQVVMSGTNPNPSGMGLSTRSVNDSISSHLVSDAPSGAIGPEASTNDDATRGVTTSPLDLLLASRRVNPNAPQETAPIQSSIHCGPPEFVADAAPVSPSPSSNPWRGGVAAGDPIANGVLSEDEAINLHAIYWARLQPVVQVLHPLFDTVGSTRQRSALLFTAICSTACRFQEKSQALSMRLERHLNDLLADAIIRGPSEIEFVQALTLLCPWMPAVPNERLDPTSRYLAIASKVYREIVDLDRRHKVPLSIEDIRARQRVFLVLSVFDVGFALMSGSPFSMLGECIEEVEQWASEEAAISTDIILSGFVALRRNMGNTTGVLCPPSGSANSRPSYGVLTVKGILEDLFGAWDRTWLSKEPLAHNGYVKVVRKHSELSMLAFALGKGSVNRESAKILVLACMRVAKEVCDAVLELKDSDGALPNNTMVMVVYAALILIKVHDLWDEAFPNDNSIMDQLRQVALWLQTWGSIVPHRKGRSTVLGSQLHEALDRLATSLTADHGVNAADLLDDNFWSPQDLPHLFLQENPEISFLLQSLPTHEENDNWLSMLSG